jgi:hypothetical protein
MKKLFNHISPDIMTSWVFGISICFIIISLGFIGSFYQSLPPFLPLYNKLPWGYARLGNKLEFFLPVGITCLLLILNIILSNKVYKKSILLSRFLGAATLIFSLSILIYTIQVILLIK